MADVVRALIVRLQAQGAAAFRGEMEAASGAVGKFGGSSTAMGATASKAFKVAALGAAGVVAVSVKLAADFDKTFAQIESLAGKIGVPMDQAKQHVLDLAKATGQDPNGLAQALYFAASAGLKANQVLPVLDMSAKAAAIGMGDAQTVAQTLTSVLNAYAGTGLDAGTAMNVMTAAVRDGKAEMSDFASGLGPIISVAANAGISFNDLAAGIAQATNQGVPFSRAVTGFRFLIQSLEAPTAKASSALQSIGLSASDVAKMLQQPGGLEHAMQLIFDRTSKMGEAGRQAWAAITGGARGSVVAVDLVGKHVDATNKIVSDLGRSAQKGATDFADAWKKISATDAVKFQQAISGVKDAMIQLGVAALPTISAVAGALGKIAPLAIHLAPEIIALWVAFKAAEFIPAVLLQLGLAMEGVGVSATGAAGGVANFAGSLQGLGAVPIVATLLSVVEALKSLHFYLTNAGDGTATLVDALKAGTVSVGGITSAVDEANTKFGDMGVAVKTTGQLKDVLNAAGVDTGKFGTTTKAAVDMATAALSRYKASLHGMTDTARTNALANNEVGRSLRMEHTWVGTTSSSLATLTAAYAANAAAAKKDWIASLQLAGGLLGIEGDAAALAQAEQTLSAAQAKVNKLTEAGKQGTPAYRSAMASLNQAVVAGASAHLQLQNDVLAYVAAQKKAGVATHTVIAQIDAQARAAGATKGQISALNSQVLGYITGTLSRYPSHLNQTFTSNILQQVAQAETLANRLAALPRQVNIQVVTSYHTVGSPAGPGKQLP